MMRNGKHFCNSRSILLSVFVLVFLVACGTSPVNKLDKSPIEAISISSTPQENVNNFTEVLQCLGTQIATHGSKRFLVGTDQIRNESGVRDGVPESGRTMLQSAFSTLVEHSNGKVVWVGWSTSVNTAVNAGFAQENKAWGKDLFINETAEFSIFGAITQFEKSLQKAGRDTNITIGANRIGNYESADLSVLATNLTLHNNRHANFAVFKGIQANHVLTMRTVDDESGIMLGTANVGGVGFNVSMVRKESVGSSLMNLMQLGAIEITGKFYKDDFDYRHCLTPSSRQEILSNTAWKKQFIAENQAQPTKRLSLTLQLLKDPAFGQPLLIKASANDTAHLYCFYNMADTSMVRIFPNLYVQNNQIGAGKSAVLPDEKLRVKLVPERGKNESVTCIASTVDIARLVTANSSSVPSKQFSIERLQQQLIEYISSSAFASETIEW